MSLEVSALYVHPLKSGGAIALASSALDDRGLVHDRRYMVVDEAGDMLTQRTLPRMCLIRTAIVGDAIELAAPGMPSLVVHGAVGPRRTVRVWRSVLDAPEVSPEATAWISAFLGVPCAIVHMPSDVRREVNPKYARSGELVSFADGYPLLVASAASLADLEARVGAPLGMRRFRPNVVVSGAAPWAEDEWRTLRIGAIEAYVTKPCVRCVITTIDPDTATKGKEPLRTLAGFRDAGEGPTFGINLVARGTGVIRVGDPVVVEAGAPKEPSADT